MTRYMFLKDHAGCAGENRLSNGKGARVEACQETVAERKKKPTAAVGKSRSLR